MNKLNQLPLYRIIPPLDLRSSIVIQLLRVHSLDYPLKVTHTCTEFKEAGNSLTPEKVI